jgi:hypothetical protein
MDHAKEKISAEHALSGGKKQRQKETLSTRTIGEMAYTEVRVHESPALGVAPLRIDGVAPGGGIAAAPGV